LSDRCVMPAQMSNVSQRNWIYYSPGNSEMIKWAIIFALISVVAGILGFTGISADSAAVAKVLFFIALAIFVVLLIAGLVVSKKLSE